MNSAGPRESTSADGDAAVDVARQQDRLARRDGGEDHRGDAGRGAAAEVERRGGAEQLGGQLLGFLHAVRGVERVVGRRHRRQVVGERCWPHSSTSSGGVNRPPLCPGVWKGYMPPAR